MVLDRFFKALVLHGFTWPNPDAWLSIGYYPNPNFFADTNLAYPLIIGITTVVLLFVIGLFVYGIRYRYPGIVAAGVWIILGGMSNFWDRLKYQHVLDYVGVAHWPVFNIADILIFIGVIWYGVIILRSWKSQGMR